MTRLPVDPPSDVAAILAGVQRVVAVRGTVCWYHANDGSLDDEDYPCVCGPPADLVAATEVELVTTCATCEGSGRGGTLLDNPPFVKCPDCTLGFRVHGRVVIGEVLRVVDKPSDAGGQPFACPVEGRFWFLAPGGTLADATCERLDFLPPVATLTEGGWYLALITEVVG